MVTTLLDMILLLVGKLLSPKHMDVDFWKTVSLWDSISELIAVVGWTKVLSLTLSVYEHLYWEFLSSLIVD